MGGEWKPKRIGELGKVVTGKTPSTKKPEHFGGEYPFITIPDLDGRRDITKTARTLSPLGAETMAKCLLPPGAVMMSCIATIGKCGITTRPSFTNQQINSVICGNDVDPKFLYYIFKQLSPALEAAGGGGSVYTNVSKSRFSRIEVLLPPLKEQQAIAHILGTLDDKIELNRRMNETLEAMARAIFKSWFVDFDPVVANAVRAGKPVPERFAKAAARFRTGVSVAQGAAQTGGLAPHIAELFPDGFEDSELGEIPRGWEVGSLGKVTGFLGGYAFKSKDWTDQGVPVVKIGSVKPGIVDLNAVSYVSREVAEKAKRFRLAVGDLLIGMTGYVGEVGLVPPSDNPPLLNQRVGKFVLDTSGTSALAFLYCQTRRTAFKTQVAAKSHGTAQANVSAKDILSIQIVVPPKTLRCTFNLIAQPFIEKILANHAAYVSFVALRNTLLPQLISGELRVPDAERLVERCI